MSGVGERVPPGAWTSRHLLLLLSHRATSSCKLLTHTQAHRVATPSIECFSLWPLACTWAGLSKPLCSCRCVVRARRPHVSSGSTARHVRRRVASMLMPQPQEVFPCTDCGHDCKLMGERYMVTFEVWARAQLLGGYAYMLCVRCLELRIGRRLVAGDFIRCGLNDGPQYHRSLLLRSRLHSV